MNELPDEASKGKRIAWHEAGRVIALPLSSVTLSAIFTFVFAWIAFAYERGLPPMGGASFIGLAALIYVLISNVLGEVQRYKGGITRKQIIARREAFDRADALRPILPMPDTLSDFRQISGLSRLAGPRLAGSGGVSVWPYAVANNPHQRRQRSRHQALQDADIGTIPVIEARAFAGVSENAVLQPSIDPCIPH